MFDVSARTVMPGFQVQEPGFRVGSDVGELSDWRGVDAGVTPAYVPRPGGDGSGSGYDRCILIPGYEQFGMCLYLCPDGTVRRSHDIGVFGGQPWILRSHGLGL
jgi:hypothetical protein